MTVATITPQNDALFALESPQPLSRSLLWQLQRNFFAQQGINAWREGIVPHYITSNTYLAQAYAELLFAWLRDLAALGVDHSAPIYLVELGAGSGRLAYHLLRQFFALVEQSPLRNLPITYILTDLSLATVESWQRHPQLQPWLNTGRLDIACFDAERDQQIYLRQRGTTVTAATLRNPIAVIANYVFDGLSQDLFRLMDGRIDEALVSLTTPQPVVDCTDSALLEQVTIHYSYQPARPDYYADADFDQLLQRQQTLEPTHLLFPLGALACIRSLYQLSQGRLFLLSADKGYHDAADLRNLAAPDLTRHGSFSLMVNYHILGEYVRDRDGLFFSAPTRSSSLDICAALFDPQPQRYQETRLAYQLGIIQRSPADFFTLKKAAEPHFQTFTLPQLLAYLRLSGCDYKIFLDSFPALLDKVHGVSGALAADLQQVIDQIWENYYHIGEARDLPFALALLLFGIGDYAKASAFLHHSLRLYGPEAATFANLATCYQALGQEEMALTYMQQAQALDPTFAPTQSPPSKSKYEEPPPPPLVLRRDRLAAPYPHRAGQTSQKQATKPQ